MMNMFDAAKELNGNQYREEGSKELFAKMKVAGLAAVFGASDDLMEIRGAIYDEVDCYGGGEIYFNQTNLLSNDCECDDCPYFRKAKETAKIITAVWDDRNQPCWKYETTIPHTTFEIKDGDDVYCVGLVFHIESLGVK